MAKHTQQEAILAFFNHDSKIMRAINQRTQKYITFNRLDRTDDVKYYVGKKGAIRIGKTVADSIPMREPLRQIIIKKGMELLNK